MPGVSLGDADYQAQVSLGQPLLGLLVPLLNAPCQLRLLLAGQKRYLADLLQIRANRIVALLLDLIL